MGFRTNDSTLVRYSKNDIFIYDINTSQLLSTVKFKEYICGIAVNATEIYVIDSFGAVFVVYYRQYVGGHLIIHAYDIVASMQQNRLVIRPLRQPKLVELDLQSKVFLLTNVQLAEKEQLVMIGVSIANLNHPQDHRNALIMLDFTKQKVQYKYLNSCITCVNHSIVRNFGYVGTQVGKGYATFAQDDALHLLKLFTDYEAPIVAITQTSCNVIIIAYSTGCLLEFDIFNDCIKNAILVCNNPRGCKLIAENDQKSKNIDIRNDISSAVLEIEEKQVKSQHVQRIEYIRKMMNFQDQPVSGSSTSKFQDFTMKGCSNVILVQDFLVTYYNEYLMVINLYDLSTKHFISFSKFIPKLQTTIFPIINLQIGKGSLILQYNNLILSLDDTIDFSNPQRQFDKIEQQEFQDFVTLQFQSQRILPVNIKIEPDAFLRQYVSDFQNKLQKMDEAASVIQISNKINTLVELIETQQSENIDFQLNSTPTLMSGQINHEILLDNQQVQLSKLQQINERTNQLLFQGSNRIPQYDFQTLQKISSQLPFPTEYDNDSMLELKKSRMQPDEALKQSITDFSESIGQTQPHLQTVLESNIELRDFISENSIQTGKRKLHLVNQQMEINQFTYRPISAFKLQKQPKYSSSNRRYVNQQIQQTTEGITSGEKWLYLPFKQGNFYLTQQMSELELTQSQISQSELVVNNDTKINNSQLIYSSQYLKDSQLNFQPNEQFNKLITKFVKEHNMPSKNIVNLNYLSQIMLDMQDSEYGSIGQVQFNYVQSKFQKLQQQMKNSLLSQMTDQQVQDFESVVRSYVNDFQNREKPKQNLQEFIHNTQCQTPKYARNTDQMDSKQKQQFSKQFLGAQSRDSKQKEQILNDGFRNLKINEAVKQPDSYLLDNERLRTLQPQNLCDQIQQQSSNGKQVTSKSSDRKVLKDEQGNEYIFVEKIIEGINSQGQLIQSIQTVKQIINEQQQFQETNLLPSLNEIEDAGNQNMIFQQRINKTIVNSSLPQQMKKEFESENSSVGYTFDSVILICEKLQLINFGRCDPDQILSQSSQNELEQCCSLNASNFFLNDSYFELHEQSLMIKSKQIFQLVSICKLSKQIFQKYLNYITNRDNDIQLTKIIQKYCKQLLQSLNNYQKSLLRENKSTFGSESSDENQDTEKVQKLGRNLQEMKQKGQKLKAQKVHMQLNSYDSKTQNENSTTYSYSTDYSDFSISDESQKTNSQQNIMDDLFTKEEQYLLKYVEFRDPFITNPKLLRHKVFKHYPACRQLLRSKSQSCILSLGALLQQDNYLDSEFEVRQNTKIQSPYENEYQYVYNFQNDYNYENDQYLKECYPGFQTQKQIQLLMGIKETKERNDKFSHFCIDIERNLSSFRDYISEHQRYLCQQYRTSNKSSFYILQNSHFCRTLLQHSDFSELSYLWSDNTNYKTNHRYHLKKSQSESTLSYGYYSQQQQGSYQDYSGLKYFKSNLKRVTPFKNNKVKKQLIDDSTIKNTKQTLATCYAFQLYPQITVFDSNYLSIRSPDCMHVRNEEYFNEFLFDIEKEKQLPRFTSRWKKQVCSLSDSECLEVYYHVHVEQQIEKDEADARDLWYRDPLLVNPALRQIVDQELFNRPNIDYIPLEGQVINLQNDQVVIINDILNSDLGSASLNLCQELYIDDAFDICQYDSSCTCNLLLAAERFFYNQIEGYKKSFPQPILQKRSQCDEKTLQLAFQCPYDVIKCQKQQDKKASKRLQKIEKQVKQTQIKQNLIDNGSKSSRNESQIIPTKLTFSKVFTERVKSAENKKTQTAQVEIPISLLELFLIKASGHRIVTHYNYLFSAATVTTDYVINIQLCNYIVKPLSNFNGITFLASYSKIESFLKVCRQQIQNYIQFQLYEIRQDQGRKLLELAQEYQDNMLLTYYTINLTLDSKYRLALQNIYTIYNKYDSQQEKERKRLIQLKDQQQQDEVNKKIQQEQELFEQQKKKNQSQIDIIANLIKNVFHHHPGYQYDALVLLSIKYDRHQIFPKYRFSQALNSILESGAYEMNRIMYELLIIELSVEVLREQIKLEDDFLVYISQNVKDFMKQSIFTYMDKFLCLSFAFVGQSDLGLAQFAQGYINRHEVYKTNFIQSVLSCRQRRDCQSDSRVFQLNLNEQISFSPMQSQFAKQKQRYLVDIHKEDVKSNAIDLSRNKASRKLFASLQSNDYVKTTEIIQNRVQKLQGQDLLGLIESESESSKIVIKQADSVEINEIEPLINLDRSVTTSHQVRCKTVLQQSMAQQDNKLKQTSNNGLMLPKATVGLLEQLTRPKSRLQRITNQSRPTSRLIATKNKIVNIVTNQGNYEQELNCPDVKLFPIIKRIPGK